MGDAKKSPVQRGIQEGEKRAPRPALGKLALDALPKQVPSARCGDDFRAWCSYERPLESIETLILVDSQKSSGPHEIPIWKYLEVRYDIGRVFRIARSPGNPWPG